MSAELEEATASQRAVKDTGKLFLAHLGAGACSVAFSAWLFRLVPDWGLALWPVCVSLGGAIAALGSLGMGDSFIRLVPDLIARGEHDEAARVMRTGLLLNTAICAALAAALWVCAEPVARVLLHQPEMAIYIPPLALAAFFTAMRDRLGWGLGAIQAFGKKAILRFGVDVLRSPLAVLFYHWQGVHGLLLALTVVPMADCILAAYWQRQYLLAPVGLHPVGGLLRFSLPYYGVSLSGFLQGQAHYLVVGAVGGAAVLAPYFVAYRLADYLRSLDRMSVSVMTPKLSERGGVRHERRPGIFRKCTRYLFLGMLPLHIGAAVLAKPLLSLYGGADYAGAAGVFALLCVAFFVEAWYLIHRAHIQVFARPVHLLVLQVAAGVLTVCGLLLLVPALGATGAALNVLVVSAILIVLSVALLQRTMSLRYDSGAMVHAVAASLAVGAVAWSLQELMTLHAVVVAGAALVSGGLAYIVLVSPALDESDLDVVVGALPGALRRNGVSQRLRQAALSRLAARQA